MEMSAALSGCVFESIHGSGLSGHVFKVAFKTEGCFLDAAISLGRTGELPHRFMGNRKHHGYMGDAVTWRQAEGILEDRKPELD